MAKGQKTHKGTVVEALPNTQFRVQTKNGNVALCYLSGKMRKNKIYVLVGDRVEVVLDDYGDRGRITYRR